jgi:hypothetical protein
MAIRKKKNILEYIVTIYLASSALDAAREVGLLDRKVMHF